jgi:hypothetical protein
MTPLYDVSAEAQNDLFEIGVALHMTAWHWLIASKASFPNCSHRWDGCRARDILARPHQALCPVFFTVLVLDRLSAGCEADPHHGRASRQP